ncbi:hypothetical protein QUF79_15585 [Fictibacillus enclensis]|uniref:hypothetical protein n=1 Tax=Fictibacillus enclensis TaxID=1017270 RepID=UPI0025A166F8|nr:hypothetical protein [Fictibacillus enclensis]MDM5199439.1 hypothetical protein [Fictibacillus enclensis]
MKRFVDFIWDGLTLQHMNCNRFMMFYVVHYVLLFLFSITLFILSLGVLLLYKTFHIAPPFGIWAGMLVSAMSMCCFPIIGTAAVKRLSKVSHV